MHLRSPIAAVLLLIGGPRDTEEQRLPAGAVAEDIALYSRLLSMTDTRQLDASLIQRVLASKWRPLRGAGILAIGQIGADQGMAGASLLRAHLADADQAVA